MVKLQRPVVLSLCLASVAAGALACNLVVDRKFQSYDEVDGGCDFAGKGTACGACIAQKCGTYVAAICEPEANGSPSTTMTQIEACAADGGFAPDARASSACLVATASGAATEEINAFNCVNQKCANVTDSPCVTCRLPGKLQDGGTTDLRHSGACGACLLDMCANVINSACCSAAIVLNSVASCADPKSATCKSLIGSDGGLASDGGKRDAEANECVAQTVACAKGCVQQCN
jgi:hypothetical protein